MISYAKDVGIFTHKFTYSLLYDFIMCITEAKVINIFFYLFYMEVYAEISVYKHDKDKLYTSYTHYVDIFM